METFSLTPLSCKNKEALVRVDFNVPLDKNGNITDDSRINATLPTIKYLLKENAKVILLSHLGRPNGKQDPKLSLQFIAADLEKKLHQKVLFLPFDSIENNKKKITESDASLFVMENLRFYAGEEDATLAKEFAKKLATLGNLYVNDAFSASHRKHASVYFLPKLFKGKSAFGLLMEKEITMLTSLTKNPQHPFFAIIGGAKISTKIGVLKSLVEKVDAFCIGGGMAYTFFKALGVSIGDSIVENDFIETAKEFLSLCKQTKTSVYLPTDVVIADSFSLDANFKVIAIENGIPKGWEGMDIGPSTEELFSNKLSSAKSVFWNGPLGVFELPNFAKGTNKIAKTLSELSCTKIVGGGDSVSAIKKAHLEDKFTFLSTGGGASLSFIESGTLPGIEAIE